MVGLMFLVLLLRVNMNVINYFLHVPEGVGRGRDWMAGDFVGTFHFVLHQLVEL